MKRRELLGGLLAAPALLLPGRLAAAPPAFPILFGGGIPRWALGADLATDYTIQRDYAPVRGLFPPGSDTHASTIYAPSSAGVYQPFAANVPVLTNLGLQTVPTRIELIGANAAQTGTGWANTNTVISAAPANDSPANDNNAKLVTQGGTIGDGAAFQRTSPLTGATPYVLSQWFKYTGSARFIRFVVSDNVLSVFEVGVDLLTATVNAGGVGGFGTVIATGVIPGTNGWFMAYVVGTVPVGSGSTSLGSTARVVTALGGTTVQAGNYQAYGRNLQQGSFPVPTIINTGDTTATVNGNQQVISGLGTQLVTGVAGLVQWNVLDPGPGTVLFGVNDGTSNNRLAFAYSSGRMRMQVFNGGGVEANVDIGPWPSGIATLAYALSTNFANAKLVGQSEPAPDTVVTYPAMSQLAFGGQGFSAGSNSFTRTQKAAAKFIRSGEDPATIFARMNAQAQLAAAA